MVDFLNVKMRNVGLSTLLIVIGSYIQGLRQKNFQGGQRKKYRKIAKTPKNINIKPLPGEGGNGKKDRK